MIQKATRQQTKEHNRNLVLRTIFDADSFSGADSISRAEIARVTELTKTTVSDIVADLLAEGLVSEVGVGESLGGKSPILLSLVSDSRYLIGLDLAHNQFQGAVVNLRGEIRKKISLPVKERMGQQAISLVYRILDELLQDCPTSPVGIGVGTPGLVDPREGVVLNAVNLDWVDFPLERLLTERYHLPVTILNDSQAAAVGEFNSARPRSVDGSMVVINARHGIGAGIILNGRLFQGDGGDAGEIGHITVMTENGLPCRCGNHGCLETVSSAEAIENRLGNRLSLEEIARAYRSGQPDVCKVVDESAHYLGLAISHLVGVLNVRAIVISGDMACFGDTWLDRVVEAVHRTSFRPAVRDTRVTFGRLGADAVLLGTTAGLVNNFSLLFTGRLSN
jgi:predicted NBD/HSP70 family sugar kinase